MEETPKKSSTEGQQGAQPRYKVNLSVPWADDPRACVDISGDRFYAAEKFLIDRSRVHETYIREEAKTKRLSLMIGAVLFLAGCLVLVFAPAGREALAVWVGAAMLIVAAGCVGYKRVWAKSKVIEIGADQSSTSLSSEKQT